MTRTAAEIFSQESETLAHLQPFRKPAASQDKKAVADHGVWQKLRVGITNELSAPSRFELTGCFDLVFRCESPPAHSQRTREDS